MTELHRLLYCSRNTIEGDPDEVAEEIRGILAKSRANNVRDALTGGLMFTDGCFVQVLEGPLTLVERAFERIQCDPRHEDVTVLQISRIEQRDFPQWSMAFAGSAPLDAPLAAVALDAAFAGHSAGGEEVLDIMRGLVVREGEWAASPEAARF